MKSPASVLSLSLVPVHDCYRPDPSLQTRGKQYAVYLSAADDPTDCGDKKGECEQRQSRDLPDRRARDGVVSSPHSNTTVNQGGKMRPRWKQLARTAVAPIVRRVYAFVQSVIEEEDLPRFANEPRNLRIHLPRRISGPEWMVIGDDVLIGPGSLLIAQPHYPTASMRHPYIDHPIQHFDPRVVIGNRVTATGGLTLSAMCEITIEDDVMFASNVLVADGSHGYANADEPYKYQPMCRIAAVHIKRGSWIGQNVVILPGVTIGELAIIGANSVVTRDVPARSIAVGSPARVIKRWDTATQSWDAPEAQEPIVERRYEGRVHS